MKMKKLACMLLALTMAVGLFTGCGSEKDSGDTGKQDSQNDSSQDAPKDNTGDTNTPEESQNSGDDTYPNGLSKTEPVVLKLGIADQGNGTAQFDAALKLFQSMYPNVEIETTISADIETIVDTKINAGDDDDMFDLFWSYSRNPELIAAGALEPCEDIWDYEFNDTPGTKIRDLAPAGLVDATYYPGWPDGKEHVAIFPAMGTNYYGFFYNKALFEEKGWNQDPQTWQEFLDLCAAIKKDDVVPLISTGVYSYYLTYSLVLPKSFELAHEAGDIDAFTESFQNYGNDFYNNTYLTETWNKIGELGKLGYWHTGLAGMNHTQAQMQVLQGKAAMVASGTWIGNEMADSIPEGFEWGYMMIPFRETKDTPIYIGPAFANAGLVIWANKPETNKAWCKEFLRLMCDMSVQEGAAEGGGIPYIRTDFADNAEGMGLLHESARVSLRYIADHECISLAEKYKSIPSGASLAQAQQNYSENYVGMMMNEVNPETVLTECQALLDKAREGN